MGGAAYASGLAASTALAAVPKLSVGTNYVPSDMYAQIHQGERVMPAADNRAVIAALENNTGNSQGGKMNVQVHNYGSSNVSVEQMDESTVRLIVRDEAPQLISKHAPGVIAGDIGNPNSKTSKALARSTYSTRRR